MAGSHSCRDAAGPIVRLSHLHSTRGAPSSLDLTVMPPRYRALPRPPDDVVPEGYHAGWLSLDAEGSRLAVDVGEGALVWDVTGPPDALPLVIPGRASAPFLALHPTGRWLARGGTGGQAVPGIAFSFLGERLPITLPGHGGSVAG
jgi:hypothetical protein